MMMMIDFLGDKYVSKIKFCSTTSPCSYVCNPFREKLLMPTSSAVDNLVLAILSLLPFKVLLRADEVSPCPLDIVEDGTVLQSYGQERKDNRRGGG